MKIQEQLPYTKLDDDTLRFFKALGVDYVAVNPAPDMRDGKDRLDYWQWARRLVESHGMQLMNVAATGWDEISLGRPDRDEKIATLDQFERIFARVPSLSNAIPLYRMTR